MSPYTRKVDELVSGILGRPVEYPFHGDGRTPHRSVRQASQELRKELVVAVLRLADLPITAGHVAGQLAGIPGVQHSDEAKATLLQLAGEGLVLRVQTPGRKADTWALTKAGDQ